MDILDTTTNTWSKGPSMAKRRATQDCIVTEHNGERGVMVMLKFLYSTYKNSLKTGTMRLNFIQNHKFVAFFRKCDVFFKSSNLQKKIFQSLS